jgi:hypothetical protein
MEPFPPRAGARSEFETAWYILGALVLTPVTVVCALAALPGAVSVAFATQVMAFGTATVAIAVWTVTLGLDEDWTLADS